MHWPRWWSFIVANWFSGCLWVGSIMGKGREEVAYLYSPQVISWLLAVFYACLGLLWTSGHLSPCLMA